MENTPPGSNERARRILGEASRGRISLNDEFKWACRMGIKALASLEFGPKRTELDKMCPNCNSSNIVYCSGDEDPDEILGDMVQCKDCGRKTDTYEAIKRAETHSGRK